MPDASLPALPDVVPGTLVRRSPLQRAIAAWRGAPVPQRIGWVSDSLMAASLAALCMLVMFNYEAVFYAVIAGMLSLVLRPFSNDRLSRSPVMLALLLWVVTLVLSDVVNGLTFEEAHRTLYRQWRLLTLVLMLNAGPMVRRLRPGFLLLLLLTGAASVYVAWQQRSTGTDPIYGRNMAEWFVESTGKWRGNGLVDHPLTLAGQCAMLAIAVLVLALHSQPSGSVGRLLGRAADALARGHTRFARLITQAGWRALALLPLAVLGVGLIAAASRGYIAVLLGITAVMLVVTLRGRWLALGAVLMLAALPALTLMPTLQARFATALPQADMPLEGGRDRPLHLHFDEPDRIARLYFGLQIVRDYPVFGVGADHDRYWAAFASRAEPWMRAHHGMLPGYHVHNSPLQIAIEGGLVGFVAWLAIWLVLARTLSRQAMTAAFGPPAGDGSRSYAWPLAGLFVLLLFLAAGCMFEHNFDDSEVQCLLWLLVGMSLWQTTPRETATATSPAPAPWPFSGWVVLTHLLWIGLAVSAAITQFHYPRTVPLAFGSVVWPRESVALGLLALSAVGVLTLRSELARARARVAAPAAVAAAAPAAPQVSESSNPAPPGQLD
ncbi:MAG: O-antigen ligase family protein [Planctomycetota bacterium]